MTAGLTIGKAAREAGVGVETIRFYERQRLVAQPLKPTGAGMRLYAADTVERIRFIKEAQELGFTLREVTELLTLRADASADCADVRVRASAKIDDVHRKIQQLQTIGAALGQLVAACPGSGGLQACSIMDALASRSGDRVERRKTPTPSTPTQPEREQSPMKNATFKIEGMRCDGCANTVRSLVEKELGVQAVAVSFTDGQARVLYDPQAIDEERLVTTIQKPGFRVVERQ